MRTQRGLRISIDSKAKVKIGNLSRRGKARTLKPKQANDHDEQWESILVPFGILDVMGSQLSIYFGQSAETSDFIVDCLAAWWQEHQADYPDIQSLAIDLDNGPAVRSNRTQFIKRMDAVCSSDRVTDTTDLLSALSQQIQPD